MRLEAWEHSTPVFMATGTCVCVCVSVVRHSVCGLRVQSPSSTTAVTRSRPPAPPLKSATRRTI